MINEAPKYCYGNKSTICSAHGSTSLQDTRYEYYKLNENVTAVLWIVMNIVFLYKYIFICNEGTFLYKYIKKKEKGLPDQFSLFL